MKSALILLLILAFGGAVRSQDSLAHYVASGTDLHDRGYFEEAIASYDSALRYNPFYYTALYEKALTLAEMKRYPEAATLCASLIEHYPDSSNKGAYVLYGTMLDNQGKGTEAVKVYGEGIRKNPQSYLLYFNRGVTQFQMQNVVEAEADLIHALARNPYHAGSHNVMAYVQHDANRVYAILANTVLLAVEPRTERSRLALARLDKLIGAGVEKKDSSNINITLFMPDEKESKKEANNFRNIELILSLSVASSISENKNDAHAGRLVRIMETLAASLAEQQKEGRGFAWRFYAPFVSRLKKDGHLET
ncbi:MAG: tetratricopeptide repeat protein, partial [Sphingobacteriales bacterium]